MSQTHDAMAKTTIFTMRIRKGRNMKLSSFKKVSFAVPVLLLLIACSCAKQSENENNPSVTVTDIAIATEQVTPTKAEPTSTPTMTPTPTEHPQTLDDDFPSLAERYSENFSIGVALCYNDFLNEYKRQVIAKQFNSITCGNEMKADTLLSRQYTLLAGDEEHAVLDFTRADKALQFCSDNNIKLRGHTLCWHSQVPKWFFTVGYSNKDDAVFVTKEVMLKRLENYIKDVMEYVNTSYPGVVYAWDVVNEAVDISNGVDGYRSEDSYWYQVIGKDFIEKAFEYARKYADPEQKLFYNDYNTEEVLKCNKIIEIAKGLMEKGLIDGIGLQSHLKMGYPDLYKFQESVEKYGALGLEIQITELDIDATDNSEETQLLLAIRYQQFMSLMLESQKNGTNITNITFWGLTDDGSWLNDSTPSYPLLFSKLLEAKPAYWGIYMDGSIPLY